ncbi:hypothetical protein ACH5RR_008059 [Cinchona calisaya]|uniref:Uncharacterized protein n=1 Tax=Cinchona calisaya TaxID=153742 RepID=A0ABD3AE41_9GENT
MESTGEVGGLFGKIMPPKLDDAGLEDCALPPESIKEAFLKAATAVRSIISASSYDDEAEAKAEVEGHCVNDPWPEIEDSSDELVGISDGVGDVPGSCAAEKGGGLPEVSADEVAVRDADEKVDEVVIGGPTVPDAGEACVDGLQGLEIGEKSRGKIGKKLKDGEIDNEEQDGEKEKPILAEGYV